MAALPRPALAGFAGALRARGRAWWQARHPRSDTLLLTQRNIYILPTRAGWAFALTLLALLVASINYQLSLGYLLTFLLAGSGAVSLHVTHGTLRALTLHLRPPAAVFAGDAAIIECVLTSSTSSSASSYVAAFGMSAGSTTTAPSRRRTPIAASASRSVTPL